MKLLRFLLGLAGSPWMRLAALLALGAVAYVSLVPAERSPPRTDLPEWLEHFLAYAVASGFMAFAFRGRLRARTVALVMTAYAAALESGQFLSPGRAPDLAEFLAGAGGAVAGTAGAALLLGLLARIDGGNRPVRRGGVSPP